MQKDLPHPAYLWHAVCARVNDVSIVKVNTGESGENGRFSLRMDEVRLQSSAVSHFFSSGSAMQVKKVFDADPSIKLIFLCSRSSPLRLFGRYLSTNRFKGTVVVDKA